MNTTDVLGVRFANISLFEAVELGMRAMTERTGKYIVAPDSEMMLAARKRKRLMSAINGAELILPAGSGIVYASHILGIPIKKKITALDYASALMARMGEKGMRLFILSTEPDLLERALKRVRYRYPGIEADGCINGAFASEQELLNYVNQSEPDLLLVCLGTLEQELWMYWNSGNIRAGLMLGYGRELSILAGMTAPIPQKWRDAGFEWLYRLIHEPWLIVRMIKRTGLIFAALGQRLLG